MVSQAESKNNKMRKELLQSVAELVHRKAKKKIVQLNIPSKVPKGLNFLDSIQIKWVDYFTPLVGSELLYSINIEEGRQRGSHVPIDALYKWCIHKLGKKPDEARRMAYAIEEKIYNEGIKGQHVFRLVLEDIEVGRVE